MLRGARPISAVARASVLHGSTLMLALAPRYFTDFHGRKKGFGWCCETG
jgi:hypothetical protein